MIWKFTSDKNWATLEERFSWVADMHHVPQHKLYHAEGSVATHTRMVLEALTTLPYYQSASEQEQEILWTAALLHDVEKRSTSVDEGNGIITSHNHARWGEYTARTILYRDVPAPFYIREQIASLVRYHGLPIWLMDKPNPAKKIHEVSQLVNTAQLCTLAKADALGRICNDLNELLESIELFELFCKEQDCWGKPRLFSTPHARFHYFNTENSYADYIPFEDFKCKVTLLSGLPGMGKDHYIQSLGKDIPVVSLDDIRRKHKISPTDKSANGWVVQTAREEAKKHLRKGEDFIWNATNITRQMRSQLIDLFVSYGAWVQIVYIEKPYNVWRSQNRNREYPLPETVLDKMLSKLEVPQITEADEVKLS
ncbi:AAA family ATPase [Bacteroides sp. 519]|uniref:AAA family ATPase n=1 Tax=Bacteroides sp. 519 TaxID=2302937 RepID=UPI0013D407A5|nr:AAA family ATPase [Bacteroides sp. 519]NDV58327.1 HD domain-containing protein [Bacteroides sp. 519]